MYRSVIKFKLSASGDTIVEVLVCMAIVTTVLAGAFVVTHRNTIGVEDSSEHHTALKLAQTQLEELKGLVSTNPNAVFEPTSSFCFTNVNNVVSSSSALCKVNNSGTPSTTQPAFSQTISHNTSNDSFVVTVTWPDLSGSTGKVQLSYIIHKPVAAISTGSTAFIDDPPYDCILYDTCGDPSDDDGGGPPPPPAYFFGFAFINTTDASEKNLITGCAWNFGDGTPVVNNQSCMPGDQIDHEFPPPSGLDPSKYDPTKCYTYIVTITLTTHLKTGLNPIYTQKENLPGCP